jgi:hypothetical protein
MKAFLFNASIVVVGLVAVFGSLEGMIYLAIGKL